MITTDSCLVLFSGGRDSTLAAIEMSSKFKKLILVTVTAEHLYGIKAVNKRLDELKKYLPSNTIWLKVIQPFLPESQPLFSRTCLPCQKDYIGVGLEIAKKYGIKDICIGYAGYQSSWPEQTPLATKELRKLLSRYGINLHLPIYSTRSKVEIIQRLIDYDLDPDSLEQKCIKQIDNLTLPEHILKEEIKSWVSNIENILVNDKEPDLVIEETKVN